MPGDKICDDCRKKVAKYSPPQPSSDSSSESDRTASPPSEMLQVDTCESLCLVNQYLDTVGATPIKNVSYRVKIFKAESGKDYLNDAKGYHR